MTGDVMPTSRYPSDKRRMAFGNPTQDEEGGGCVTFVQKIKNTINLVLYTGRQSRPIRLSDVPLHFRRVEVLLYVNR